MPLPNPLLAAAEAHACFTGCYSHETPVATVVDLMRPPVTSFHAACQDCLMFHLGSLASLLPPGMTQYGLAQELAAHMRTVRGYRWAISGYHATGPGFWLSAAYYGNGLFILDGSRNHGGARDVALLVDAFKQKLVSPDDQGMLDPALYATEIVHLSMAPAIPNVRTKRDILNSPQCSLSPRQGLRRVALVEFLPLTTKAPVPPPAPPILATSTSSPPPAARKPAPVWTKADEGKTCPACRRTVKELTLVGKTEYNCMC